MQDYQDQATGNSFTTGFTLGVLTGAVGYFLFGTPQGAKVRREMLHEWELAKERMMEEGVIPHQQVTFREFLHHSLQSVAGIAQEISSSQPIQTLQSELNKKTRTNTASKPKKSTQKFRGV